MHDDPTPDKVTAQPTRLELELLLPQRDRVVGGDGPFVLHGKDAVEGGRFWDKRRPLLRVAALVESQNCGRPSTTRY